MEAYAITIHAVEMLNYGIGDRQIARAIWALVIEQLANKIFIFFPVNLTGQSWLILRLNS